MTFFLKLSPFQFIYIHILKVEHTPKNHENLTVRGGEGGSTLIVKCLFFYDSPNCNMKYMLVFPTAIIPKGCSMKRASFKTMLYHGESA